MIKLNVSGIEDVIKRVHDLEDSSIRARRKTFKKVGRKILGRAKQLVPVDTGRLRDSGDLQFYTSRMDIVFTAPYALAVHERTDVHHKNGQAKFLQQALNEFAENYETEFAERFKFELRASFY